ncbi:MAG: hypothetical protein VYE73_13140 [Acidobacteriota bacterium]|nr:hypothetical protein [Acidobacteriota bacterium]
MPILEVEVVVQEGEALDDDLASWLAESAGQVLSAPPGGTWVRLRTLPADQYGESGGGPPPGVRPVFVRVLQARPTKDELVDDEVQRLSQTIGELCNRPARNVHILYDPPAAGRIAFGGRVDRE